MKRRWAGVLVAGAALFLIAAIFFLRASSKRAVSPAAIAPRTPAAAPEPASAPLPPESRRVTLWLPAAGGLLAPLEVEVSSAPEPKARIEALLRALLAATPAAPMAPLFDPPVTLAAAMRGAEATLYVDLASKDGAPPPGSGSTLELQRVYSIVHTVVRNEPSVERVALLWNGVQRRSLAGHVDTGRALEPRPDLEARAPGARPESRPEPPPEASPKSVVEPREEAPP